MDYSSYKAKREQLKKKIDLYHRMEIQARGTKNAYQDMLDDLDETQGQHLDKLVDIKMKEDKLRTQCLQAGLKDGSERKIRDRVKKKKAERIYDHYMSKI